MFSCHHHSNPLFWTFKLYRWSVILDPPPLFLFFCLQGKKLLNLAGPLHTAPSRSFPFPAPPAQQQSPKLPLHSLQSPTHTHTHTDSNSNLPAPIFHQSGTSVQIHPIFGPLSHSSLLSTIKLIYFSYFQVLLLDFASWCRIAQLEMIHPFGRILDE